MLRSPPPERHSAETEPTRVELIGQSREVEDQGMDSVPLARRSVLDEVPFAGDTEVLGYRFPVDIE